jgi:hypothetical protein
MKTNFDNLPGRIQNGVDYDFERRRTLRKIQIRLVSIAIGFVIGLCAIHLHAQIKMKYIANAAAGGPAPEICRQEASMVRTIISQYEHPAAWTWVIACDESSWNVLALHLRLLTPMREVFAATDRKNQITYVRGYTLIHPLRDTPTVPENVIVHELVHADLNSADEDLVERVSQQRIKDRPKQLLASAAQP